jgi:hypothetical protein
VARHAKVTTTTALHCARLKYPVIPVSVNCRQPPRPLADVVPNGSVYILERSGPSTSPPIRLMGSRHPLLQYDIVDLVLAHCADPSFNTVRFDWFSPVPYGSEWFAGAARTCKAWLDPAQRRLYHTVRLDAHNERGLFILSVDIVARIGHRVRTLVLDGYGAEDCGLNGAFHHFTHLTSLILWKINGRVRAEDDKRLFALLSCPSLPNLANLTISSSWYSRSLPILLGTTKNLRQLVYFYLPNSDDDYADVEDDDEDVDDDHSLPDHSLETTALEKLENLSIFGGYRDEALSPLLACRTPLAALTLSEITLRYTDYSLVDRLIRASSRSLCAISLHELSCDNRRRDADGGWLLLRALASCTSVRFLQLSSPVLDATKIGYRELFELLAPLPIEFLSLFSVTSAELDDLIDSLSLLPSLLAIHSNHKDPYEVIKKFDHLPVAFEYYLGTTIWPPPFENLSWRARELFRYRPYRKPPCFVPFSLARGLMYLVLSLSAHLSLSCGHHPAV